MSKKKDTKKKTKLPQTLDDLKAAEYNPRTITTDAAKGLDASLNEFGNISGITFNRTTGRLVTGHQRVAALKERGGEFELLDKDKGEIRVGRHVFPVRIVAWSLSKEKAANISANNSLISGEFVDDVLKDLLDELEKDDVYDSLRFDDLLNTVTVPAFDPIDDDDQPRLDEKKKIECPACGHEFVP